jgi:hypothetical protein
VKRSWIILSLFLLKWHFSACVHSQKHKSSTVLSFWKTMA